MVVLIECAVLLVTGTLLGGPVWYVVTYSKIGAEDVRVRVLPWSYYGTLEANMSIQSSNGDLEK